MEPCKIDRINELARKSRIQPLTQAEKDEQRKLRVEYIEAMKASLVSQLEHTSVLNPDGTKTKLSAKKEHESTEE